MYNFYKKYIFALVVLVFTATPVFAYYNPGTSDGFVNDFGKMMLEEEVVVLESKLVAFEVETSNEISVVTIPSLEEDYIENFAVELFNEWGIGKKSNDNGVLILVARDDREMRIEVGYGLEGALTDLQSAWIIENVMKPEFKEGNYFLGIDGAINNIMKATRGEYVPGEDEELDFVSIFIVFSVGGFFLIWTLAGILGRSKSWWAGGVIGVVIGIIIGFIKGSLVFGITSIVLLASFGLLFDITISRQYAKGKANGRIPWWAATSKNSSGGSRSSGSGGFRGGGSGGFGGGRSGGGGASGGW